MIASLRQAVNVRCPSCPDQAHRPAGGRAATAMLAIKIVLIIFSQFASHRVQLNMRIIDHGALLLVIAIIAADIPEVNTRKYMCNRTQDNKSRRCNNYKEKSEHYNPYPSRAPKKGHYVKVQSFFEFFFGGFVRPFTGRVYDGIQRIYPENRKTPKVLQLVCWVTCKNCSTFLS